MCRLSLLLNTEYAKCLVQNELLIADQEERLIATYKEAIPSSEWKDLTDDEIYAVSLKKKQTAHRSISNFRSAIADISHVTTASIVEELDEARELAKKQDNPATMIAATMSKAKTVGLIVNRVETKNSLHVSIEAQIKTVPQEFIERLANNGAILPKSSNIIDVEPN